MVREQSWPREADLPAQGRQRVDRRAPALKRIAVALTLAAALAAGCGGGHSRRDRVEGYIKDVNGVQRDSQPSFKKANAAYARFARGQVSKAELEQLQQAETSIRDAKVRLAQLRPPADARRLSALILDLYDADASFAHETALLASYLPEATKALRPLAAANARLQKGLGASSGAGAAARQAAVLRRYALAIQGIVTRLRGLDPPPLLKPAHDARIRRLAKTTKLAGRLRKAIQSADVAAIGRDLLRFRRLGATKPPQGLTPDVIRAYDARYAAVRRKAAAVAEESARLGKVFGGGPS